MEKNKSFLWREISEKDKEQIHKEAKKIMDDFSKALEKVKYEKDFHALESKDQTREETKIINDKKFREKFLEQVPQKEGDWVIAEKGKWKK